jgi:hypothetical protein
MRVIKPLVSRIFLLLSVTLVFAFPVSALNATGDSQPEILRAGSNEVSKLERGRFERVGKVSQGAQIVKIGIEPSHIYGVDLATGTWAANLQVWWRWTGDIDPTATSYFTNNADAVIRNETTFDYVDTQGMSEPIILSSGEKYQRAIIRMGFVEDFELDRFPLDRQFLRIRIENDKWDSDRLVYEFDEAHISKEKQLPINGWISVGTQLSSYIHHYETDFGNLDEGTANQDYSHLIYSMEIKRNGAQFYIKLLFPLIIVLIASYSALAVRQLAAKSPLAIASTGLLTTLFSQQAYSKDLPSQAPVVLIDKIYLAGLFTVLMVFIRVVVRTQYKDPSGKFDELKLFMGRKSDLYFGLFVISMFGVLTSIFIIA